MCQRGILRRVRSTAQPYGGKYREWPWDVAPLCVLWRRIRTYCMATYALVSRALGSGYESKSSAR